MEDKRFMPLRLRHGLVGLLVVLAVALATERRPASQAPARPQVIAPASDVAMRAWNATVSDLMRTGALRQQRIDEDAMIVSRTLST